jgi:hypothetical protein
MKGKLVTPFYKHIILYVIMLDQDCMKERREHSKVTEIFHLQCLKLAGSLRVRSDVNGGNTARSCTAGGTVDDTL